MLEKRLVEYYNTLREELYPITTELLAYECLAHKEDFLGGASAPNFTSRVSDFLRHWRKRNIKTLRKPTSIARISQNHNFFGWKLTGFTTTTVYGLS